MLSMYLIIHSCSLVFLTYIKVCIIYLLFTFLIIRVGVENVRSVAHTCLENVKKEDVKIMSN